MKLIIDIPEEDYDYLYVRKEVEGKDLTYYHQLILNGIPIEDLKLKIEQDMCFDMFDDYGNKTAIHKELWEILDNIGKEESEE